MYRLLDAGERPDLAEQANDLIAANLPRFMMWESPGNWRWAGIYDRHPDYQVFAMDGDELVAAVNGVPLHLPVNAELPDGFDDVLVRSAGVEPGTCAGPDWVTSLLSISVRTDHRAQDLPLTLLAESQTRAGRRGHRGVLIPLRPTRKTRYQDVPIDTYAGWVRDGTDEPFDPWLRTHVAAGGQVLGTCPRSLVIHQPVRRWKAFLAGEGSYQVAGGLAPVQPDGAGSATYAEPNIWVWHSAFASARLRTDRGGHPS